MGEAQRGEEGRGGGKLGLGVGVADVAGNEPVHQEDETGEVEGSKPRPGAAEQGGEAREDAGRHRDAGEEKHRQPSFRPERPDTEDVYYTCSNGNHNASGRLFVVFGLALLSSHR